MERKWLFFDIDGTLVPFGEDARPSPRTLEALSALRAQGHKVFLCTGRTKCDIGKTLLCFDVDGVISGAGARIEMDGVCVREKLLPLRLLRFQLRELCFRFLQLLGKKRKSSLVAAAALGKALELLPDGLLCLRNRL